MHLVVSYITIANCEIVHKNCNMTFLPNHAALQCRLLNIQLVASHLLPLLTLQLLVKKTTGADSRLLQLH